MSAYDNMPVGGVLRGPGLVIYYRLASLAGGRGGAWYRMGGGHAPANVNHADLPPGLVELVEKPAEPANLRDADGSVWIYAGQAYRLDNDDRHAPTLVLRAEIEGDWGPVTEVPR